MEPHPTDHAQGRDDQPLDFSTFAKDLVNDAKEYVAAEKRLVVLNGAEKASNLMAGAVRFGVTGLACSIALILLSFALAWWLGEHLSSLPLGFALVGMLYVILAAGFLLWWNLLGRDRFVIGRINQLTDGL